MSAQSPYGISSWAFWPVGDRYQLSPKWKERYTDFDNTVSPRDEVNRLDLVGAYWATDVWFILQLRDMSDPKAPKVPDEVPLLTALVWKQDQWLSERSLPFELVMETPEPTDEDPSPEPVWTGDVKITVEPALRDWLGDGTPARFSVDAEFPSQAPERVRAAYGTLVLRR
jgi:hypothetical protein